MKQHTFTIADTPRLDIRIPVGELRIVSGAPGVVEVDLDGRDGSVARFTVEQRGSLVSIAPDRGPVIRWSSVDITVRVGVPPEVHARLTSGGVTATTELQTLTVETASGDVVAGSVRGDATIRSASGDVRLGDVGGRLSTAAASGDIRAESVESAEVKSASGDVYLREVRKDAEVGTASGDIVIARFSGERLAAKSISGDVGIGVPPGRRYEVAFTTLSGEVRTDFPVGAAQEGAPGARLEVKTVSGDIRVKGA